MAKRVRAEKAGNTGKTAEARRGSMRAALDQAAALEALAFLHGGEQLALPGLAVRRFVGVAPLPDDDKAREPGRPVGARNQVPLAFREYLVAKYGSAVEGLAQDATRPVISIVAELAQAYIAACRIFGREVEPTSAQIAAWVETAKSIQLASRRYVAPYQHSQAPQPKEQQGAGARIAVAMFTGGAPAEATKEAARDVLADLLGIEQNQRVIEGEARELNAEELNAEGDDDA